MSKAGAIRFILKCQNWGEIAIPLITHQRPTKISLRNGICFEAPEIYWWDVDDIYFKRVYNPLHLQIERNDIVVDIGANIGLFTVYAASRTQNTVYALEPSASNFEVLKQNICANGLNNVIPLRSAISDMTGSAKLFLNPGTHAGNVVFDHTNLDKLERIIHSKIEEFIEVPTTTLQDFMDSNNIEQIDFLKVDCEGSEGSILGSTSKNYLKRIKKIAMEFHDDISKLNHHDMRRLLEEAGFFTDVKWDGRSPLGQLCGWRD